VKAGSEKHTNVATSRGTRKHHSSFTCQDKTTRLSAWSMWEKRVDGKE
jgi:hypothetical protein